MELGLDPTLPQHLTVGVGRGSLLFSPSFGELEELWTSPHVLLAYL